MAKPRGLSPLARGTRHTTISPQKLTRFIPAGAGNTRLNGIKRLSQPVYPRWRGEHGSHSARGAYWFAVYPRWRGEHWGWRPRSTAHGGLSPLARGTPTSSSGWRPVARFIPAGAGTHISPVMKSDAARFIPAGAGNTRSLPFVSPFPAVYPRWRGEHSISTYNSPSASGLSPLARGTPAPVCSTGYRRRFIPAGAGNTVTMTYTLRLSPVYPRWRGEHHITTGDHVGQFGLSPLARGTQGARWRRAVNRRFIPAGAGNTSVKSRLSTPSPVYPRWRGEH